MSERAEGQYGSAVAPMPRRPKAGMPKGACDCHCHVFGPYELFPLAGERTYAPPEATGERYLSMLDTLGCERGVLVQASAHGLDNRAMLHAIANAPDRLRGVAVVDAETTLETLQDLYRAGVRGLRIARLLNADGSPRYKNTVDVSALDRLLPHMQKIGLHAQLWTTLDQLESLEPTIRSAGIPFVLDHMGRSGPEVGLDSPEFDRLCGLVADGYLWVKLTPYRPSLAYPDYDDMRPYHERLLQANPDRMLWGSDWPHINMDRDVPDAGHLVDLLAAWTKDRDMLHKILVSNPARLYGFE